MEPILFLGGKLDGRIINIPYGDRHYLHSYTTERIDASDFSLAPYPSDFQEIPYKREHYNRTQFKLDEKIVEVMLERTAEKLNSDQTHELKKFFWIKSQPMNRPNRIELPKQELQSRIDSGELILCNTEPLIAVKSVADPSAFAGSSWQSYIESHAQFVGDLPG